MSFIPAAEAALEGRASQGQDQGQDQDQRTGQRLGQDTDSSLEVVEREPGPVFDADGLRTLLAPLFAAFMWAAAIFRETLKHEPLDALTLVLRVFALALTLRALLSLRTLLKRLRMRIAQARYGLVLADEGLLFRTPEGDFVVMRSDILDVRERGDWRGKGGRRWADVYVITRPDSGRTYLALPPRFTSTPGMLAERLMRWRGVGPAREDTLPGDSVRDELPSKLWERLAAGQRPSDVAVIPHGSGWLAEGPYNSVLLGVAVLDGYLRIPAATRAAMGSMGPVLLALFLVAVPLTWILHTRTQMAKQRGLALVLTRNELLLRTRAGILRAPWSAVSRVEIATRRRWSLVRGAHEARTLVLHRKDDGDIQYSEALIEPPLEAVAGLCDAYRKSSAASAAAPIQGLEPESTPAS